MKVGGLFVAAQTNLFEFQITHEIIGTIQLNNAFKNFLQYKNKQLVNSKDISGIQKNGHVLIEGQFNRPLPSS